MPFANTIKRKEYNKQYYLKNREKLLQQKKEYNEETKEIRAERDKQYYLKNKEEIKKRRKAYSKYYSEKNKIRIRENTKKWYELNKKGKIDYKEEYKKYKENHKKYKLKRYAVDITYRVEQLVRRSFLQAFNLYTKNGKTKALKEYGIDISLIVEHLGHPPQDGKTYHIDHIFPVSAFDLNNPEHIKLCWHPSNLQWLEANQNIKKSNIYDESEFKKYIYNYDGF